MKKLKIGIMGTRGIPNRYGGFEQFAEYLSHGLVQRGHEVYVYNSSRHSYREKTWKGIQLIHCAENKWLGTAGQFLYDWNCIHDSRKRNFDILLHLGYTSDALWHWYWPAKTIHIVNVDGMEWMRSKYNFITRKFLKQSEAWIAKHADILIADSPAMQKYFQKRYNKKPAGISYGANAFTQHNPGILVQYGLVPHQYFLLIARMEPENNIEMILKGYLASGHSYPFVVTGNMNTGFGKYIRSTYHSPKIKFTGSIFEPELLNNLRCFSLMYFHGHSVGGTNPSLLEAMACSCSIAAHDNIFNQAVLQQDAAYFSNETDVASLILSMQQEKVIAERKKNNIEKIQTMYAIEKNIDDYEQVMLAACGSRKKNLSPVVAEVA